MGTVHGKAGRMFISNLQRGSDLLGSLEKLAKESGVQGGAFVAIGAVRKAAFGYFDQSTNKYVEMKKDEEMEIASCSGNFGIFEGKPKVHCHVVFSDREGHAYGGHLFAGTEVFVGEVHLLEVEGVKLERTLEPATGLTLLGF